MCLFLANQIVSTPGDIVQQNTSVGYLVRLVNGSYHTPSAFVVWKTTNFTQEMGTGNDLKPGLKVLCKADESLSHINTLINVSMKRKLSLA